MNLKKALKILNINRPVNDTELKKAYHLLVKSCHPDQYQNHKTLKSEGEEKLKQINLAYEYLTSHSVDWETIFHQMEPEAEPEAKETPGKSDTRAKKKSRPKKETEKRENTKQDATDKTKPDKETEKRKKAKPGKTEKPKREGFFSKLNKSVHDFFKQDETPLNHTSVKNKKRRSGARSFGEILGEKDGRHYQRRHKRKMYSQKQTRRNWMMLNRRRRRIVPGESVERIEPVRPVRGFTKE